MEQIPDPEATESVKEKLEHSEVVNRAGSEKHPLTGFVRCGKCRRCLSIYITSVRRQGRSWKKVKAFYRGV